MTQTVDTYRTYSAAAQEDRCAPRFRLKMPGKLRPSGTTGFAVTILDLSIAGFSCEAVTSIRPGTYCWLSVPGLNGYQAEVIWNDGIVVGCAFSSLLNQAVLDSILARYR
jgi:hypothetical protein